MYKSDGNGDGIMSGCLCRVCLTGAGEGAEEGEEVSEPELQRKLSFACQELQKIMSDPNNVLPNRVCSECYQKINTLYNFYNIALNSYNTLTSYLNNGLEDLQNFYKSLLSKNMIKIKLEIGNVSHDNKEENSDGDYKEKGGMKRENFTKVKKEPEIYKSDKQTYSSDDDLALSALQAVKIELDLPHTPKKRTKKLHKKERKALRAKVKKQIYNETQEDAKAWKCLTCFEILESRRSLKSHYYEEHDIKTERIKIEAESDENVSVGYIEIIDKENEKKCQCSKCKKIFPRQSIDRHLLTHTEVRPFVCNLCGRRYKSVADIILHDRAHNGDKTLACDRCDYSTVYPGSLNNHMKTHTAREYRYTCKVCDKGFDVKTWFNEHMNVHSDDKPFGCDECGKMFHFSKYVTAHKARVHPGKGGRRRANTCTQCAKRFHTRPELRRHQKTEHRLSFLCDHCGKELSSKEHLKFHVRIHLGIKPHACGVCGKAFVKKSNLTLHERVHSGEKPYVCVTCGKAFSQRSTLVIHMRNHSGSRPFQCSSCSKTFVARGLLTVHQKTCG